MDGVRGFLFQRQRGVKIGRCVFHGIDGAPLGVHLARNESPPVLRVQPVQGLSHPRQRVRRILHRNARDQRRDLQPLETGAEFIAQHRHHDRVGFLLPDHLSENPKPRRVVRTFNQRQHHLCVRDPHGERVIAQHIFKPPRSRLRCGGLRKLERILAARLARNTLRRQRGELVRKRRRIESGARIQVRQVDPPAIRRLRIRAPRSARREIRLVRQRGQESVVGVEQVVDDGRVARKTADQHAFHERDGEGIVGREGCVLHQPAEPSAVRSLADKSRHPPQHEAPAQTLAVTAQPAREHPDGVPAVAENGNVCQHDLTRCQPLQPVCRIRVLAEFLELGRLDAERAEQGLRQRVLRKGVPARRQIVVRADKRRVGRNHPVQMPGGVRNGENPPDRQGNARQRQQPEQR